MPLGPDSNVVSLAAYRASVEAGCEPVVADHIGALFEWTEIGRRLAPEDLAVAVGYLKEWPSAPQPRDARVYPFKPRPRGGAPSSRARRK